MFFRHRTFLGLLFALSCVSCTAEKLCRSPCAGSCSTCEVKSQDKKVEVVCYGGKTEEFCVPGPSKKGCKHCETVCDACDKATTDAKVCAKSKSLSWFDWCPGCATVHTRTKLMKRVETKTVPSYKWSVNDPCDVKPKEEKPKEEKPKGDKPKDEGKASESKTSSK